MMSDTLIAMQSMLCFLWRHVLLLMRSLPWRLAEGDIEANLRALGQSGPPLGATLRFIRDCVIAGDNMWDLVCAVFLMRFIPWTILMAEQAHGAMAAVRRYHKMLAADMMKARSFLGWLRPLLFPDKRADLTVTRWRQALEKLRRRRPQRASPQGVFVARCFILCFSRCS